MQRLGSTSGPSSAGPSRQGASPHTPYGVPRTPLLGAQAFTASQTPFMGPLKSGSASSSQQLLEQCPFPECSGENKPMAKFCSECGRPIVGASRSATPSLSYQSEFVANNASPMPNLDRLNSYAQEQQRQQEAAYQTQEQYGQQTYDQQQQQQQPWDEQGYDNTAYDQQYQQQQYDPATGYYTDGQYAQQEQVQAEPVVPEPEPVQIIDPLNRFQGCPLVSFGFGGKLVTLFPVSIQGDNAGFQYQQPTRQNGALKFTHLKDVLGSDPVIAGYPGPLLMDSSAPMKNKRKDVLQLIEAKIHEYSQITTDSSDAHRVLIWRLFKVMFEQESTLVGGAKVDEAVRNVLQSIPLPDFSVAPAQQTSDADNWASILALQNILRQGDRAGAVRHAIQSKLWAHALLLSSHGEDKSLWKEAVDGFLHQGLASNDVSQPANGLESLRVLYALLSGKADKSVFELAPPNLYSQLVDGVNGQLDTVSVPSNSLAQWRDTLAMILSNRTEVDHATISLLGDLLVKQGWVEAGHICYLLLPQSTAHHFVLLGADHGPNSAYPYYKNVEAFQKTEIYEFACALRSSGATGGLPFLQAYKLIYVLRLIDQGMLSEAGRYLESVEMIVKSQ
ncbi:hypothetical protein BGW38_007223, partial [Lunasporangiospora selenospora]